MEEQIELQKQETAEREEARWEDLRKQEESVQKQEALRRGRVASPAARLGGPSLGCSDERVLVLQRPSEEGGAPWAVCMWLGLGGGHEAVG